MDRKESLIKEVLDRELKMFLTVPTLQKASCQEDPESFRLVRGSQFYIWSEKTIESYLNDIKKAEEKGKNLMTLKYARMDNLIPKLKDIPLVDKIVEIQLEWQKEMFNKYPCMMGRARPLSSSDDTSFATSFETYLRGELETYSEKTLSLYYGDVRAGFKKGENMMEKMYIYMVKQLGYHSLDDAETTAKRERPI